MDVPMALCKPDPRRQIHAVIQRSDRARDHTIAKSSISRCRENPLRSLLGARTTNRHR